MSKKKEQIDEGMIMISSLLPVGPKPTLSMRGNKKDNFVFKGMPQQFDKNGVKIMDEDGNKINDKATILETVKKYIDASDDKKQVANELIKAIKAHII